MGLFKKAQEDKNKTVIGFKIKATKEVKNTKLVKDVKFVSQIVSWL